MKEFKKRLDEKASLVRRALGELRALRLEQRELARKVDTRATEVEVLLAELLTTANDHDAEGEGVRQGLVSLLEDARARERAKDARISELENARQIA